MQLLHLETGTGFIFSTNYIPLNTESRVYIYNSTFFKSFGRNWKIDIKRQVFFILLFSPISRIKTKYTLFRKKGFLSGGGVIIFQENIHPWPYINLELVKSFWSLNWEKQLWDQKFQKGEFSLQFFAPSIPKLPFFSPPPQKNVYTTSWKKIIITWDKQSSTFL